MFFSLILCDPDAEGVSLSLSRDLVRIDEVTSHQIVVLSSLIMQTLHVGARGRGLEAKKHMDKSKSQEFKDSHSELFPVNHSDTHHYLMHRSQKMMYLL